MKIQFGIDDNTKNPTITIQLSDLNTKAIKNITEFLNDPSSILVGISYDGIIIILEKNVKALWRMAPASKYDFIHISELGTLLLNKDLFQKEISNEEETETYVKIEPKGDNDE